MATSNPSHPSPGTPGRHGRGEDPGDGPSWAPDLPRPDWWVDGAQAMGRDWPTVQGSAWDGTPVRPAAGRRGSRSRRQEPPLRLPYAALAAARAEAQGRAAGRPGAWGRALATLGRALAALVRALRPSRGRRA